MNKRSVTLYGGDGLRTVEFVEDPERPGVYTNAAPLIVDDGDFFEVEGAPGVYVWRLHAQPPPPPVEFDPLDLGDL